MSGRKRERKKRHGRKINAAIPQTAYGTSERAFPRKLITQGDLIRSRPYRRYSTTESPAAPENKGNPRRTPRNRRARRIVIRLSVPVRKARRARVGEKCDNYERGLSALLYAPFEAADETDFRVASDER